MPRPDQARPKPNRRPAIIFREAIEAAEAGGANREDLILRLTLRDQSELKRDRSLAVSDISFKDGEMRFLGVKVERDGAAVSILDGG